MSQHHERSLKLPVIWGLIALAGLLAGGLAHHARDGAMRRQLLDDVRRSTVAFDRAVLAGLTATAADLGTPRYAALKERLQRLAAVDPAVRFAYVFRVAAGGAPVVFLADSALPGSKDESKPGDVYPQAAESPGLQEIIRTGQPTTEGPLGDDFGVWVTGYATITESGRAGPGDSYILGLDIDAADWRRSLWVAAVQGSLVTWIVFGLPLVGWRILRHEGEQREVIRNFSEAMEQSHSAIMIVDLESRIEYANRGLCEQIGFGRRELIGRKWTEFQVAGTSGEVVSDLIATVRAGRTWEGEWCNKRKDESVYPVRGVVTPVKQRDGAVSCFVAVFDDVTETKRRETELREARDLAQAGDRAKGQFLATMSHEVRTPLNGIVGFTSLLLETKMSAEQRDYVETIKMSTEALIQLTGDILDFARIESGKLKLDPAPCNPRECVEDAFDLLATKAAEKRIELVHHVAPEVPGTIVTDGGRLRQILVNLIGNAVKFTEHGEIEVRVTVEAPAPVESADGAARECVLRFSVRDTGIGIARAHHAKLFRPFTQADESTTRRYGGTGLGLAICRNLAELMGGSIGVESEHGKGATFVFTVRAGVAAPQAPERTLTELRIGLAVRPGTLRRELAQLLRGWKAQVVEVDLAEDLVDQPWDVAVVNVCEDVARDLAAQPPLAGLPPQKTVGLVPMTLPNDVRSALRAHFRLLLNRPVHHDMLFALLSNALHEPAPMAQPACFGLRVLVAEDNAVNRKLIARVLETLGCTAVLVENGRMAVHELQQRAENYDLMLLDLHMPELDGMATLREMRLGRAGPRAQSMWVIALTAEAREEERMRGLAAGLNDYLTKPLHIPALENSLRRFRQEQGRLG